MLINRTRTIQKTITCLSGKRKAAFFWMGINFDFIGLRYPANLEIYHQRDTRNNLVTTETRDCFLDRSSSIY